MYYIHGEFREVVKGDLDGTVYYAHRVFPPQPTLVYMYIITYFFVDY